MIVALVCGKTAKRTHFRSVPFSRASFSAGSLSSSLMVSSSTPRNMRQVAGPSCLSDTIGKPSRSHKCVSNAKLMWHSSERGLSCSNKVIRGNALGRKCRIALLSIGVRQLGH